MYRIFSGKFQEIFLRRCEKEATEREVTWGDASWGPFSGTFSGNVFSKRFRGHFMRPFMGGFFYWFFFSKRFRGTFSEKRGTSSWGSFFEIFFCFNRQNGQKTSLLIFLKIRKNSRSSCLSTVFFRSVFYCFWGVGTRKWTREEDKRRKAKPREWTKPKPRPSFLFCCFSGGQSQENGQGNEKLQKGLQYMGLLIHGIFDNMGF